MKIILFLLIGLLAGWLSGKITKGKGFGLLGNLVVGVLGALLGGFIFAILGMKSVHLVGMLITAVVGSIILLWLVKLVKK